MSRFKPVLRLPLRLRLRVPLPLPLLVGAALWGGGSLGCSLTTPPCEQSCRKVVRCELVEGLTIQECTLSCNRQDALYEDWEDEAKLEALEAHRRCIFSASCEELEAGVCYDEDLFVY